MGMPWLPSLQFKPILCFLMTSLKQPTSLQLPLTLEPRDPSGIFLKLKPEVKSEVVTKEEAEVEEEAEAMAEADFKVEVEPVELSLTSTTLLMNGQSCH